MMVTEKGQVTIPKSLRERFGLLPGTHVEFVDVDGHIEVRRQEGAGGRGASIVERMRGAAGPGMTTDEIMSLTRGED